MNPDNDNPPCEELQRLQREVDALTLAVRKANDILAMSAESPDTLRRRRNSIKRWHEIHAIACERLAAHAREHRCSLAPKTTAS